jgi:hypothetical protein
MDVTGFRFAYSGESRAVRQDAEVKFNRYRDDLRHLSFSGAASRGIISMDCPKNQEKAEELAWYRR